MVSLQNWSTVVTYNLCQNTKVILVLWYVSSLTTTLSKLQWSKNVRIICQHLPRQPVSEQGASISRHSTSNVPSSKFGKHSPCTWLLKREFYSQQTTPSLDFNYLRRSKTIWHLTILLKFLKARCQGTALQQPYYSSFYMSNSNCGSHFSICHSLIPLQSIIGICQCAIKSTHNISWKLWHAG